MSPKMIAFSATNDSKAAAARRESPLNFQRRSVVLSAQWKSASARMPNLARLQRQALNSCEQGHFDKAERLSAAILEYRGDDFDALHLLGFVHLQRGRNVEAIGLLTKAVRVNATSIDALSNLGLALQNAGRFEEGIGKYRKAL